MPDDNSAGETPAGAGGGPPARPGREPPLSFLLPNPTGLAYFLAAAPLAVLLVFCFSTRSGTGSLPAPDRVAQIPAPGAPLSEPAGAPAPTFTSEPWPWGKALSFAALVYLLAMGLGAWRPHPSPGALATGYVWLLALLPLAFLASIWLVAAAANLALGYWPRPYQPDPKDLGWITGALPFVWIAIFAAYPALVAALPAWLRQASFSRGPLLRGLAAAVLFWGGLIYQVRTDPLKILEWLAD